jgi:WXG100 protein secretion system (Wss), protein YukD
MGTVLITVVRGNRRRDLAVRGDVPIAVLLRPLADALAHDSGAADRTGEPRRPAAPPAAPPLAPARGLDPSLPPPALAAVSDPTAPPLALAPVCGVRLPPEWSLEACGVGHGAVLVLLD